MMLDPIFFVLFISSRIKSVGEALKPKRFHVRDNLGLFLSFFLFWTVVVKIVRGQSE